MSYGVLEITPAEIVGGFFLLVLWNRFKPKPHAAVETGSRVLQTSRPTLFAVFPGNWNGAGGMVHSYNRQFHRQAADWYCQTFYKRHGRLPIGTRTFKVTFGKGPGFDVQTPLGNGSGTRTVTIKFVMVPPNELENFIGSDLNYEIRL